MPRGLVGHAGVGAAAADPEDEEDIMEGGDEE